MTTAMPIKNPGSLKVMNENYLTFPSQLLREEISALSTLFLCPIYPNELSVSETT